MGQSASIYTQIEIEAPPETVRSVFLNWEQYPEWTKVFALTAQNDKLPTALQPPKDSLTANLKGTVFRPAVVENTPAAFQWRGNFYGLLIGTHQFYFTQSKSNPGGTLFVQKEDFTGPMAILFRPGWSATTSTQGNFEEFNRDIKAAAEQRWK